jgi:hypothetical protein
MTILYLDAWIHELPCADLRGDFDGIVSTTQRLLVVTVVHAADARCPPVATHQAGKDV